MEKWELTPLDAYNNRVYRIIVLIIPIFCLCASATITVLHYIGWYPVINETAMWLFVLSDVLYLAIGFISFESVLMSMELSSPQC